MESMCGNMLKCCLGQRSAWVLTKIWWLSSFSKILFVGSQSEINEQLKCLFRSTFRLFPFSFQPSNAQTHIRTPSIVFRIINFNQTMPSLVLDLESSSMCCCLAGNIETFPSKKMYLYLSLVERKASSFWPSFRPNQTWGAWQFMVFLSIKAVLRATYHY